MTRLGRFRRLLRRLFARLPRGSNSPYLSGGYRLILILLAALAIDLVFPTRSAVDFPVLEAGMVASETVIAEIPFDVRKSEDELRQLEAAANAEPPVFVHRPEFADSALRMAGEFFAEIEAALAEGVLVEGGALEEARDRALKDTLHDILDEYRIVASDTQLALLVTGESREQFVATIRTAFDSLLRAGVVASSRELEAASGGVHLRSGGRETLVRRDTLVTMKEFYGRAASGVPAELGLDGRQLFRLVAIRFAVPTITFDAEATEANRAAARQAVDPVKYHVLKGEAIVRANERVRPEQEEWLRAYQESLAELGMAGDGTGLLGARLGGVLFNLLLLTVFGLVLKYFKPQVYGSNRSVTLLWILVLAVSSAAALIAATDAPTELIPVAFAALIIAMLFDGLLALLTVFVLVALVAARPPLLSMTVIFATLMGGSAAALSGRVVRGRAHALTLGGVIAAAYLLAAISLALMLRSGAWSVIESTAWGAAIGFGSAFLAMGILPIAEAFTGITTDQTLLELADLNRPLLRRLSLEAPGTYAHSINVANLAEAASREVGANSLLVRVGVYYHDIGKLKKSQYFVENQPKGSNPHDKLKPATSASIVREHVKDGLVLAEEARLPDVVKHFIGEHHGTQRVGFFWETAKELDPDAELDINDFTYPGPKPQRRETAIVLIADSVESAARVLQDPTPEKIEELVDRIAANKIADGQLDEAPLTMREISMVKQQFVKVLSGMYHHRLDYPMTLEEPAAKLEETVAREAM